MQVTRESLLEAFRLFRKTIRSKREKDNDFMFALDDGVFSIAWGNTCIDLSAIGTWPKPVPIPGTAFYAIIKYPPTADPIVFEIKDGRFFCGGWSCQSLVDDPAPDLFTEQERQPAAIPPNKPSRKKRNPSSPAVRSPEMAVTQPKPPVTANMTKPIRNILEDLENIRENLLAFSDDVWLDIDHNDTQSLERGIAFKKRLNEQIDAFGTLSDEMTHLIQEYTQIQTEGEATTGTEVGGSSTENNRIVKDLNQNEAHSIAEEFTYKRPCGFIFEGVGYQDINTWSRVYELVLRQLAKKDAATFKGLSEHPETFTRRDNRHFSRNPEELRKALALPEGINAEINLSANHICSSIRTLLKIFSLPETSLTLFLRQDRNA